MISPRSRSRADGRRAKPRGMAAVELAFLLPMLVFASMAAIDFARVAYVQITLQNCARNGALYEFYKAAGYQMPSGWTSLSAAVQADAGNLTVTVPSTYGGYSQPLLAPVELEQLCHGHGAVHLHPDRPRQRRLVTVDQPHGDADPIGLDADARIGRDRELRGMHLENVSGPRRG